MLTGENGLLSQAQKAKEEQSHAIVKEAIELAYSDYKIEISTSKEVKEEGKIASTKTVTVQGKSENQNISPNSTFKEFLLEKKFITKEGKVEVEKLIGKKLSLGNGDVTLKKDIYIIEEVENEYILNYYDPKGGKRELWKINDNKNQDNTVELEPDTGKEALILEYSDINTGDIIELPYSTKYEINMNSDNPELRGANYKFQVDWGDGTKTENITNENIQDLAKHEYTQSLDNVQIKIVGKFEAIYRYDYDSGAHDGINKLVKILQWGVTDLKAINLENTEIVELSTPTQSSFKQLEIVESAFSGCDILTKIPEKLFANCQNITNFDSTFSFCSDLTEIPGKLFANCQNVTSFEGTFYSCNNITKMAEDLFIDCQKVTDFCDTFFSLTELTEIPEKLFADCQNVTSFESTFEYCEELSEIPENLFANCQDVITFYRTFWGCDGLSEIPENLFANCQKVTDFCNTFKNCKGLTKIPENLFANCQNVISFKSTFAGCENLTGEAIPLWERVKDDPSGEYNGTPDGNGCYDGCYNLNGYDDDNIIPVYWKQYTGRWWANIKLEYFGKKNFKIF